MMIYLDNHSTTPVDPVALDAMLPFFQQEYANAGSITHQAGRKVAEAVDGAIAEIAAILGAESDELVITSGATESNNLALQGVMHHPRQKRRKIVSVVTEHKAMLDPLHRLAQQGFEIQLVPVNPQARAPASLENLHLLKQPQSGSICEPNDVPGRVDWQQLTQAIDDQTALVSVLLVNNEIGVIQPIAEIAELCRQNGCLLHTDATQAVGRMELHVDQLDVDLMSFSAHKFYGPKGVGGLFVRRRKRPVRLQGQIVGGGQQNNWRSGTLNTAGIVGMQVGLRNSLQHLDEDTVRIRLLRDRLFEKLQGALQAQLNGPPLTDEFRVAGNLNCCFYPLEGQSLMQCAPELAVSSGSACTSANPEPSHVLRELGLGLDQARSSLRFGIGRFNTLHEIEQAADMLVLAAQRLQAH